MNKLSGEEMDKGLRLSATMIADMVKEMGGYMSYDDIDKVEMFFPLISFVGWGLPYQSKRHNDIVIIAHAACHLGLLANTGEGYKAQ